MIIYFNYYKMIQKIISSVFWVQDRASCTWQNIFPDVTYLTPVAVLMERVALAFYSVAIGAVFFGNDQLLAGATLGCVFSLQTRTQQMVIFYTHNITFFCGI